MEELLKHQGYVSEKKNFYFWKCPRTLHEHAHPGQSARVSSWPVLYGPLDTPVLLRHVRARSASPPVLWGTVFFILSSVKEKIAELQTELRVPAYVAFLSVFLGDNLPHKQRNQHVQ